MQDPVDAFGWLLDEFRRYSHGHTTWLDVRRVLHDGEALRSRYQDLQRQDAIAMFAMAIRARQAADDPLAGCTDDYLWRRLRQCVERDDTVAVAYLSFLLWNRKNSCVLQLSAAVTSG